MPQCGVRSANTVGIDFGAERVGILCTGSIAPSGARLRRGRSCLLASKVDVSLSEHAVC